MKALSLLSVLVLSQFFSHAQMAKRQAQQVITLKLLPVTVLNLPAIKKIDDNQLPLSPSASPVANWHVQKQLLAPGMFDKQQHAASLAQASLQQSATAPKNAAIDQYVVYTVSSL